MSYVVISDKTRNQLEQERSRLMNHRAEIVAEIEASVSAEVDHTIQMLNALLEKAPSASTGSLANPVTDLSEQVASEMPNLPTSASHQIASKSAATSKATRTPVQPKAFNAKRLKKSFKGMNLSDSILKVMQQDAAQVYATDELISALYDPFDATEMPRARKTLGATLMHMIRSGKATKVQDTPPHYKLNA